MRNVKEIHVNFNALLMLVLDCFDYIWFHSNEIQMTWLALGY